MSDFLTRRGSTWHFVRRVPAPFASLDPRGIVRQSTRIRIADDRTGRRAARIAHKLNEELEIFWHALSHGQDAAQANAFDAARRRARSLGFDYLDSAQLLALPLERCLDPELPRRGGHRARTGAPGRRARGAGDHAQGPAFGVLVGADP